MWRLFNKLFGWQYVVMSFGYDDYIRRVHKSVYGEEYVHLYGRVIKLSDRKPVLRLTKEEEQNG